MPARRDRAARRRASARAGAAGAAGAHLGARGRQPVAAGTVVGLVPRDQRREVVGERPQRLVGDPRHLLARGDALVERELVQRRVGERVEDRRLQPAEAGGEVGQLLAQARERRHPLPRARVGRAERRPRLGAGRERSAVQERLAQVRARRVREDHERDRPGAPGEAVGDLRELQVVVQVGLEPQHDLRVLRVLGDAAVTVAQLRQRRQLVGPAAGREVRGAHAHQLVRAEARRHRTVVQHVAPRHDVAERHARGSRHRRRDRVPVRHVQRNHCADLTRRRPGRAAALARPPVAFFQSIRRAAP